MKTIKLLPVFLMLLYSCSDIKKNNSKKDTKEGESISGQNAQTSIFPVTDFFKGQIADIKKQGINPIKITSFNKRIDSVWLKVENMDVEFAPFLFPVIDSINLDGLFTEKRFLDQTIDAFTFTYDPVKPLPDTFLLRRWDVYIDPNTNSVTRVYLVKKERGNRKLQLTWQTNKSCRIVSISTDPAGIDYVEKEVTIKWDL